MSLFSTEVKINYSLFPEIMCPSCGLKDFNFVTTRFDGGRLVQCVGCGHVYLNPPPDEEVLQTIYNQYNRSENDDDFLQMMRSPLRLH